MTTDLLRPEHFFPSGLPRPPEPAEGGRGAG
jgi:hypothetical protein